MHTAGRSTMHGMSWSGFVTGAVDPACMMSLLLRAWWAARPEAASAGTPLGQDGRPSTCAISGPRRPPRTFDTPNCTVSSVPVGWWRSGAANWKTPIDFFYSDMKPWVFMVPRAAGSLLKILARASVLKIDKIDKIFHAAMVAKVPCNLTPRHPPSQVLDNLPRYG